MPRRSKGNTTGDQTTEVPKTTESTTTGKPKQRKRGNRGWDYDDGTDLRPGHTWDDFDRAGRGKPANGYRGARLPWRA